MLERGIDKSDLQLENGEDVVENAEIAQVSPVLRAMLSVKEKVMQVINYPFEEFVESMIKTLRKLGLSSQEKGMVDDSVENKYVPVLRDAAILGTIGTPGAVINSLQLDFFLIIIGLLGLSWFTISLEKVKEKFGDFGVELTADMLRAFLTVLFLVGGSAGLAMSSEPMQHVLSLAAEAGFDLLAVVESRVFRDISSVALLGVTVKVVRDLVAAVIKFDANDAMLTGSTDAARRFFQQALDALRDTGKGLQQDQTLEAANFRIAMALQRYYEYLKKVKAPEVMLGFLGEEISGLIKEAHESQEKVDKKVIPVLRRILQQYQNLVEGDESFEIEVGFALRSLDELDGYYETQNSPKQALADMVIGNYLITISNLLEEFKERLEDPSLEIVMAETV